MWFEDMMKQTFNEDICFNPTKLIILDYLSKEDSVKSNYKIKDIAKYVYEVYIDNPDISNLHPSYVIRKLGTYGLNDVIGIIEDALESWTRDAINNVLSYSNNYVFLEIDENDKDDIGRNTQRLCKMLYKKYFGGVVPKPMNIYEEITGMDDKDIEVFGKSVFRNRVFEDMQYCPICEEIETENLVAVHIVDSSMEINQEEFVDKYNGLLFCKKHAMEYISHKFEFNDLGFVCGGDLASTEHGMHLSFEVRKGDRKKYLTRRLEYKKNN